MPASLHVLISARVAGKQGDDFVFTWPDGKRIKDFRATWHKRCCAAGFGKLACRQCKNVVDADRYNLSSGRDREGVAAKMQERIQQRTGDFPPDEVTTK